MFVFIFFKLFFGTCLATISHDSTQLDFYPPSSLPEARKPKPQKKAIDSWLSDCLTAWQCMMRAVLSFLTSRFLLRHVCTLCYFDIFWPFDIIYFYSSSSVQTWARSPPFQDGETEICVAGSLLSPHELEVRMQALQRQMELQDRIQDPGINGFEVKATSFWRSVIFFLRSPNKLKYKFSFSLFIGLQLYSRHHFSLGRALPKCCRLYRPWLLSTEITFGFGVAPKDNQSDVSQNVGVGIPRKETRHQKLESCWVFWLADRL